LHEGVGGQEFLNICVRNALNCELCSFVSRYELIKGKFSFYSVRDGVYVDFFCVCLDLYHEMIFNSWRMLLWTERDTYARNGARQLVRM